MNDISTDKVNKKRFEVRGTRTEDKKKSSSLVPRSSVLRLDCRAAAGQASPQEGGERSIKEERGR
jgi:hypothetical protein